MRSQNANVKNSRGSASSKSGKLGKNNDIDAKLLQQLSSKMGNNGLSSQLQNKAAERDMLLQFISAQLKNVQSIQQIELDEVKNRPEWFREVAKGSNGFFLPDPERWHQTASLYKKAGEALAQGNVGRGKQILEEALKAEDAARESMPTQVTERLDSSQQSTSSSPISTSTEGPEICPSCTVPADLKTADAILSVRATVKNAAPVRRTRPFNWWDQQEEEDSAEENQQEEGNETEKDHQEEQEQEANEKDKTSSGKHISMHLELPTFDSEQKSTTASESNKSKPTNASRKSARNPKDSDER